MSSVLPAPSDLAARPGPMAAAPFEQARPAQALRPDIEGLRGVAVLSVLAVHSFPQWLEGGFVGVDVFFVLSGYLITGLLLRAVDEGRFSLLDFYARRVRRLFPALCLVLLACLLFALLFTFPSASRQVGKHVAAGAAFVANIALWQEAGYFDLASEAKPLLHLWSLGIEEQFYLAWPLAVLLLCRRPRWAPGLLGAAIALSFALNVAFVADKPTATFFLPPSRFWELMVGALLAHAMHRGTGPVGWLQRMAPNGSALQRHAADGLAWAGLALLGAALALIDKGAQFPGWWALLPAGGSAALLAAGPAAWVNRRVLGQPVLRFYGAVSYPLYLWHWPLLSFPVVLGLALTQELRVGILIASVVLAALTYELVEKPIRHGARDRRVPLALCLALALIGLGGLAVQRSDGLLDRYPAEVRDIAAAEFRFDYADYRIGRCMLRLEEGPERFADECVERQDSGRPLLLLWGDSHAASLYPGLLALRRADGASPRLAQYTAARCPPLAAPLANAHAQCGAIHAQVLQRIAAEAPAMVLLAGHWSLYARDGAGMDAVMAGLRRTVRELHALGVPRVVVFGHLPAWTLPQPRVLMKQWNRAPAIPERSLDHLDRRAFVADRRVEQALRGSGAGFVSPIERLCNAEGCLAWVEQDGRLQPIAHDESHLGAAASALLLRRSGLELP
ncbi:MAG TPA: acyltransferase family protein [Methylibium sp.]|nr:acyltransferase family protein [Methylibium sp.]